MPNQKLKEIAKHMSKIDFCMMTTVGAYGRLQSRPMSNNGNVEFDGDSYFFTYMNTDKIKHIKKNNNTTLTYTGSKMSFIEVSGKAEILKDKALMEQYWYDDLKRWFPEGINTKGIAMIRVSAKTVRQWSMDGDIVIDM